MSESLWPDNLQCVATLSFDVDGTSPIVRDPDLSARPSLMSMREYGPSIGVPRILDLLDCFGIKASFYIPGYIAETHPEMTREIVRRGHEIGAHGYKHEPLPGMALEEETRILDKSIRIFEGLTGRAPQGYRAPSWELTPNSLRLFRERGFVYDTSLMGNDVPYHVGTGDGRLLEPLVDERDALGERGLIRDHRRLRDADGGVLGQRLDDQGKRQIELPLHTLARPVGPEARHSDAVVGQHFLAHRLVAGGEQRQGRRAGVPISVRLQQGREQEVESRVAIEALGAIEHHVRPEAAQPMDQWLEVRQHTDQPDLVAAGDQRLRHLVLGLLHVLRHLPPEVGVLPAGMRRIEHDRDLHDPRWHRQQKVVARPSIRWVVWRIVPHVVQGSPPLP